MCIYSILIVKDKAQLIQWDRTGTIVTEAISYNEDAELAEFFRQYHKAPPNVRGVDTTVTKPTAEEIQLVRKGMLLGEDTLLAKMTIPISNSERSYIIPVLKAEPYTPPGCATHGFVAWDLHRNRKVFIKDTWQVDLPGIEREGETYQLMEEAQVINIAPCSAAGDIEDHGMHMHLYADELWACKPQKILVPHHHY